MMKINNLADIHNTKTMQEITILELKAAIDDIDSASNHPHQGTICLALETAIDYAKSIADKIK